MSKILFRRVIRLQPLNHITMTSRNRKYLLFVYTVFMDYSSRFLGAQVIDIRPLRM